MVKKRIHTDEKPFICSKCDARNSKIARIQPNDKPFSCSKCDTRNSRKTKIQANDKPFSCSQCDYKWLTSNNDLKTHERPHTGEKTFNQSRCVKVFQT